MLRRRLHALGGGSELRTRLQYKLLARLRPGIGSARADAIATTAYRQIQQDPPPVSGIVDGARLQLVSAATGYSPQRESFAQPLAILFAIGAIVLLIACANSANLLLARAAVRGRELAVRIAVGAARARIVRLLVTESAVLAFASTALGLLFAVWGSDILLTIVRSAPIVPVISGIPTVDLQIAPDLRVAGFSAALSILTTILIGVTPALRGSRVPLAASLSRRDANAASGASSGPRAVLLVAQIAASLVLLVGAALLVRTLRNLKTQDLGFDRSHVLLVWTVPGQTGRQSDAALELWRAVQERVSGVAGVTSAGASIEGLLTGNPTIGPRVVPESAPATTVRVQATATVTPGYFRTVGQTLLAGRDFSWQDNADAPAVAIVNAQLAQLLFGEREAVGQRVRIASAELPPIQIVGVVRDARTTSPRTTQPAMYYPAGQNVRRLARSMCIVVRTAADGPGLGPQIRAALRDVDPRLPVVRIDTVAEQLDSVLFEERLLTSLSLFLASVAALMTGIGLYGVVAFTTARRTSEFGIRLALGATPASVVRMVVAESGAIAAVGIALAGPLAAVAARWLATRLFGVGVADPVAIGGATVLMLAVVAFGAIVPARRASRLDPMAALRTE